MAGLLIVAIFCGWILLGCLLGPIVGRFLARSHADYPLADRMLLHEAPEHENATAPLERPAARPRGGTRDGSHDGQ